MPPTRWRKKPSEFEAIQFTGSNTDEMQDFCGKRTTSSGRPVESFTPIGSYLIAEEFPTATGELWVEASKSIVALERGMWVVRAPHSLYPFTDEQMRENYDQGDASRTVPVFWLGDLSAVIGKAEVSGEQAVLVIRESDLLVCKYNRPIPPLRPLGSLGEILSFSVAIEYKPTEKKVPDASN